MSWLFYSYLHSGAADPCILFHSRLYPIGIISDKKPEEHSWDSEEAKIILSSDKEEDSKETNDDTNDSVESQLIK